MWCYIVSYSSATLHIFPETFPPSPLPPLSILAMRNFLPVKKKYKDTLPYGSIWHLTRSFCDLKKDHGYLQLCQGLILHTISCMKGSGNRIRLNVSFFHITTSLYCHIALHSALHVFQRGEAIANTFLYATHFRKAALQNPSLLHSISIFGYIAWWPPLAKLRTFQMFQNISWPSHFLLPILKSCSCLNS